MFKRGFRMSDVIYQLDGQFSLSKFCFHGAVSGVKNEMKNLHILLEGIGHIQYLILILSIPKSEIPRLLGFEECDDDDEDDTSSIFSLLSSSSSTMSSSSSEIRQHHFGMF